MSNVSQFFGKSTANGLYQFHAATISGSFTARTTGSYLITAIGGGGAGAYAWGGGGGAGGLAQSVLTLTAGDVVTYTCGAGATSVSVNGGSTTVNVNGTGVLTANGGLSTSGTVGGSGGSASGGNRMNITGGRGANGSGAIMGNVAGGGGGAVGVYGKVCDCLNPIGTAYQSWGAGTSGSTSNFAYMNAMDVSINQVVEGGYQLYGWQETPNLSGCIPFTPTRILQPTGYGQVVSSTSTPAKRGPGAGGTPSSGGGAGGMFAGGGADYSVNLGSPYGRRNGGTGGMFGGGGGAGAGGYDGSGIYSVGGSGGDGGIIIEWFAYSL